MPQHTQFSAESFVNVLEAASRTLKNVPFTLLLNFVGKELSYSVVADEAHYPVLESQLYATYPAIEIAERTAPRETAPKPASWAHLRLTHGDYYPFLTFRDREGSVMADLFHELSQLGPNESFVLRVAVMPTDRDNIFLSLRRSIGLSTRGVRDQLDLRQRLFSRKGSEAIRAKAMKAGGAKNREPLFEVDVTLAVTAESAPVARLKLEAIASIFQKLESDYNAFVVRPETGEFSEAQLVDLSVSRGYHMTASELSTIFHFPPDTDNALNLVKILAPKGEPPTGLPTRANTPPTELNLFGVTNYRQVREEFGIKRHDRARHMYVIGKSGSGKSKLLELLIKSDLENGQGLCVIDPHGDLVDAALRLVPADRANDVIYFNPADADYPISFNPIEKVEPAYRPQITTGLLEIFKKQFADQWTPRLEHVLRMSILALLDAPRASVLSILLLLTDRSYRQQVIQTIDDKVVRNFWTNEFAGWSEKFDAEAITPILNKIGQFVSNPIIRNIVSQEENKVHLPEIMDNRKILLVKLPKGILGEENTMLLGAMVVTRIYQAALERALVPEEQRVPFYLYVDEFQNFATNSFVNILSEARKYKLAVILANQYVSQLPDAIRKTVFGNVGSHIAFRVGPEDAQFLETEFSPRFKAADLTNLGVRETYVKLSVDDQVRDPFSARTLDITYPEQSFVQHIVNTTRQQYCSARTQAEQEIASEKAKELEVIERLKRQNFSAPIV